MTRFIHRRSVALAILLVVFALVAAACGDSSDDGAEAATTTAAAETPATTAAPAETPATTAAPAEEPVEPPTEAGNTLAGLTVVDDKTFTVELNTADPEFPIQLAYTAFFPLPSVAYENTLGFNKAPSATARSCSPWVANGRMT